MKLRDYLFLVLENDVEITLRGGRIVFVGPLDSDVAEGLEGRKQNLIGNIPGDAAQEDLAGQRRVVLASRRKRAGPSARSIVHGLRMKIWRR